MRGGTGNGGEIPEGKLQLFNVILRLKLSSYHSDIYIMFLI